MQRQLISKTFVCLYNCMCFMCRSSLMPEWLTLRERHLTASCHVLQVTAEEASFPASVWVLIPWVKCKDCSSLPEKCLVIFCHQLLSAFYVLQHFTKLFFTLYMFMEKHLFRLCLRLITPSSSFHATFFKKHSPESNVVYVTVYIKFNVKGKLKHKKECVASDSFRSLFLG